MRTGVAVVRLQHLFLSPMVLLGVPPLALFNQSITIAFLLGTVGLAGMLFNKRILATAASLGLLSVLVLGKVAANFLNASSPDTSVLMIEFTMVVFFMEAGFAVSAFTGNYSNLRAREDELSQNLKQLQESWISRQLTSQGEIGLIVLVLSIGLLPVAGLTSISSNQIVFSATLALLAVVILVFLVTHRREPETAEKVEHVHE